jgi:hypothetical protein
VLTWLREQVGDAAIIIAAQGCARPGHKTVFVHGVSLAARESAYQRFRAKWHLRSA